MKIFVLGNGKSRLEVDLHQLRKHGRIYGCNALYREFTPDCLVAVDTKMILEINESGYQHNFNVYVAEKKGSTGLPGFKYIIPALGYSSGPTALHLAAKDAPKEIYILGFDFISSSGCTNNVYVDTKNYKKSTDPAAYSGNWEFQTSLVIKRNLNTNFIRVTDPLNPYSLSLVSKNYAEITTTEFNKMFGTNKNS
jgi:hypothetical protein